VTPAFQQRNARDLALTQQDLSERKSARQIGYDTALTQDQNAFIERRNDVGPDQNALLQLALQYGQSGNGTGALPQAPATQQSQPQYKPPQQFQGGGVSAPYAGMMANQMQSNFLGQLGGAMNFGSPMNYGPAYTSNRYPTRRGNRRGTTMLKQAAKQTIPIIPGLGGGVGSALGALLR